MTTWEGPKERPPYRDGRKSEAVPAQPEVLLGGAALIDWSQPGSGRETPCRPMAGLFSKAFWLRLVATMAGPVEDPVLEGAIRERVEPLFPVDAGLPTLAIGNRRHSLLLPDRLIMSGQDFTALGDDGAVGYQYREGGAADGMHATLRAGAIPVDPPLTAHTGSPLLPELSHETNRVFCSTV